MDSRANMMSAVDGLYAAALGQIDWHAAMDAATAAMGFTHWSVYGADRHAWSVARPDYRLPVTGIWSRNYDAKAQRDYEAEFYKLMPHRRDYVRRPDARVYHDLSYLRESEIDRHPFYAWAEREHGVRYMAVGLTDARRPVGATLAMARPRALGAMTPDQVDEFGRLMRHFERAVEVEYLMGQALAPNVRSVDFIERNPTGIVILDGFGHVVLANRAARAMAERGDSFLLHGGDVRALRGQDDVRLQSLCRDAATLRAGENRSIGGVLKLPRRTGRRDYLVTVSPMSVRESILSELMPRVCLLIVDPDSAPGEAAEMLRCAYGLTPAETRLAQRLAIGETPEQAAAALGVSLPTVRTHLAAIFRKTDTSRQSELLSLLVSLPWWAAS